MRGQVDIRIMRYIPKSRALLLSVLLIGFAQAVSAQQGDKSGQQKKGSAVQENVSTKKDTLVVMPDRPSNAASTVYRVAEQMPSFRGDLMSFLADNIRYPDSVAEKSTDGKVVIQFIVRKNGSLTDVKVLRSAGKALDKEVLRVIGLMPPWIPGKNNGIPVDVYYILPVVLEPG